MTDEEIEKHNNQQVAKHGRGIFIHMPRALAARAIELGVSLDGYLITVPWLPPFPYANGDATA